MKKKLDAYREILYQLINFRTEQYKQSKSMIGIDYETFMIVSVIGSHYLKNNTKESSNWDSVWEQARTKKTEELYNNKRLTILAVANILNLPKETVRRKIEILKKKKLVSHTSKTGLIPNEKNEELMKPFASTELISLSKFLMSLKRNHTLDQILTLKEKDFI